MLKQVGELSNAEIARRCVRRHYPELVKKRLRVRVETPPGRLAQVDWKEDVEVQLGSPGNWVKLHAFLITLGFSRKSVMVWSERKDLFRSRRGWCVFRRRC